MFWTWFLFVGVAVHFGPEKHKAKSGNATHQKTPKGSIKRDLCVHTNFRARRKVHTSKNHCKDIEATSKSFRDVLWYLRQARKNINSGTTSII